MHLPEPIKSFEKTLLSNKGNLLLILIFLLGTFLRFNKLNWGDGFHFHPDEYHLVISANQISFPDQLHPHFFSYGTVTVYLIYFSDLVFGELFGLESDLFIVGRLYSALFSSLTLILVFRLAKKVFKNFRLAILTVTVTALTPGLIQQAHFATPESAVTFWVLLFLLLTIKYIESQKFRYIIFSAISLGIAIGTKITPLITLPAFIFAVIYTAIRSKKPIYLIGHGLPFILIMTLVYFITNPYTVLDFPGFKHSFNYETGVARGTQLVFYTRQFIDTNPIIFQFKKILPYTIDPVNLLIASLGFFAMLFSLFKIKPKDNTFPFLLTFLLTFSTYFFFNSVLFAKWTRFIAPIFPFFAFFSVYLISLVPFENTKKFLMISLTISSILWGLSFSSIYFRKDVRVKANEWIQQNIPKNSKILTESGNIVEVPTNGSYNKVSFGFYHLDEDPELAEKLVDHVNDSDYFIIQSRRIYKNHLGLEDFPTTNNFYGSLFSGKLGFKETKSFNSFPKLDIPLIDFRINDEGAEETFTVFDHPVITIYKKDKQLNRAVYENIILN